MLAGSCDRFRGEGGERRRARRQRQTRQRLAIETAGKAIAVERLGRRRHEVGVGEQLMQQTVIDLAVERGLAIGVIGGGRMPQHPVVDQRIAGARVERQQKVPVGSDVGDIRHPADIDKGRRQPAEPDTDCLMIDGHQRGPLTSRHHVGNAHVIDDRNANRLGEPSAVTNLNRQPPLRGMQHGVAVKSNDFNIGGLDPRIFQEVRDRLGVQVRQILLGQAHDARPLCTRLDLARRDRRRLAQVLAEGFGIGKRERWPVAQLFPSVRLDQSDIDPVHRCAAHQPDGALQLAQLIDPRAWCRRFCRPYTNRPLASGAIDTPDAGPQAIDDQAMTSFKSDFLNVLTERGFIHQCSDPEGVDALAAKGDLVTYVGYDCTAPSLHVGSLLSIMMLAWLQRTGAGKPIVLMGGGTTRVGDPSGKDETRQMRSIEEIESNKQGMQQVFAKLIDFGAGRHGATMVDNAEWLAALNYIAFLRDVGRHFSVNRMLTMDSAKLRLEREQELSFIEFNYMLLQAYDFVELNRRYGCNLQMGGSDQWGNIVTGIDLGRRMGTPQLYALTCPLLTTASGAKMGKTAAGAVWLNEAQLPAYDYWQYWRNTEDADVGRFLKLFTMLPMDEVAKLEALRDAEINEAKKVLATEATALMHGREKAEAAAETARKTFETGQLSADLPTVEISKGDLEAGLGVLSAFVAAGLVKSNSEARRQVQGGGLKVNDEAVKNDKLSLTSAHVTSDGVIKLSLGKKKHVLLKPV